MSEDKKPRRTWPWVCGIVAVLAGISMIPVVQEALLQFDRNAAQFFNGLLGKSESFDHFIGGMNTKAGDKLVMLLLGLSFLAHAFSAGSTKRVISRLAFWLFMGVTFFAVYQVQELLEEMFERDSPGRFFDPNWFFLHQHYDMQLKISTSRCFPSGHGTALLFAALLCIRRYRGFGTGLLIFALLQPLSRVMLGSHWFSDVYLGSMAVALVTSTLIWETPVRRLMDLFRELIAGVWYVWLTRKERSWRSRFIGAWREFTSPAQTSGKTESASQAEVRDLFR